MTTPTQAQIEAAKAAYWKAHEESDDPTVMIVAALTAAAEAGGQETSIEYHQLRGAVWDIIDQAIADYESFMLDDNYNPQDVLNKIISKLKERRSYYTAAAEVGEPNPVLFLTKQLADKQRELNATIERCIKAVWDAGGDNVEFHCAAIRALKDS